MNFNFRKMLQNINEEGNILYYFIKDNFLLF